MKYLMLGASALALAACGQSETPAAETSAAEEPAAMEVSAEEKLDAVLAAQPDETKARYQYRHPKETLQLFEIEPGMTVVDVLPGEPGWYAPILLEYLGEDGRLIGADYSMELWPRMQPYATPEFLAERETWTTTYAESAEAARGEDGASISAFVLGSAPAALEGEVDAAIMVRAAHHLNRFEDGRFFNEAAAELFGLLKPGGVLGVVQHRAPETASEEWAVGNAGYIKQSRVIEVIENAGFELVEASEINANPKDQPTEEDIVWRLPPSNQDEAAAEIGESDRMTLKFRKPE